MNKKLLIGIIIATFLIAGGYFVLSKQLAIVPAVSERQNSLATTTGFFIDTLGGRVYRNGVFGFEVQVPSDTIVKFEKNDLTEKTVYFNYDKSNYFEVRLMNNDNWGTLEDYFKLTDMISSRSEATLGNKKAMILYRPAYGEGGDPFPQSVIVAADYNKHFYQITFFGLKKLSLAEQKILSTFKFTK